MGSPESSTSMTQDEHNMLADLANKIAQTPAPPKDPEAEDFIRRSIGSRPDALYLMTQTVLIQNMALQQAQHQIQDLQQRMSQPVPSGSSAGGGGFLGQGAPPPQYSQQRSQYAPPPPQYASAPPPYAAPAYAGPSVAPPPSGMSGFLRGAAQTAAGVAAGTLAVQGIESLFSHHEGFGGGSGLFGGGGGMGGYGPGETVIENNYYGDSQADQSDRFADTRDASDARDFNDTQTQDASYDDSSALGDDSNYDDSSGNDDTSGNDDSSANDDNSV
jgi:hypothetical protein